MLDGFNVKRQILGSISESKTTLFVGLYNGSNYIDKLISQINNFSHEEIPVIFVDNDSDDSTWELIQEKADSLNREFMLVRNPANIGGLGSLLTNLDLAKSEWVTTVHQDDFYKANHLDVHLREMDRVDSSCGVIASDMGVAIANGKKGLVPRANWDFDPEDKVSCFIGSLKSQLTPNPASSYRTEFLKNFEGPFYNAAFCDTEHELISYLHWHHRWIPEITIDYMENPVSESKSVDGIGREMAIVNSLCRVFTSPTFKHIVSLVEIKEREKFVEQLITSIETRFDEEIFAVLVINQALEELLEIWGPEPYVLKPVHEIKGALNLKAIESTLRSSLYFLGETRLKSYESTSIYRPTRTSMFRSFVHFRIFRFLGLIGQENSKKLWSYTLKATSRFGFLSQYRSPRFLTEKKDT